MLSGDAAHAVRLARVKQASVAEPDDLPAHPLLKKAQTRSQRKRAGMSPYDPAIKASIRRRMARGKTLVQAFNGLKTGLWKDELRLEKAVEELSSFVKQKARQEKRALTGAEKNHIRGWNGGISMNRSRRLAADSLELSGWDPAQDE
jgi:hypothetical protein